jgi:hypothetical protein
MKLTRENLSRLFKMRGNTRFGADAHHRRLQCYTVLDAHLQEQLLIGPLLETNDVFSLNDLGIPWD